MSAPTVFVKSQSFFKIQQYFKKSVCDCIDATNLGNRTLANSAGDPFSIKYCSISIFIRLEKMQQRFLLNGYFLGNKRKYYSINVQKSIQNSTRYLNKCLTTVDSICQMLGQGAFTWRHFLPTQGAFTYDVRFLVGRQVSSSGCI